MAYGVPVVATRHSGIPEAITEGHNGLLVNPNDPAAVAGAIATLLDRPGLYNDISRHGHETIASRFSIAACARKLEASYWEAIELAKLRGGPPVSPSPIAPSRPASRGAATSHAPLRHHARSGNDGRRARAAAFAI